ncbi:HAD family hydrolase [Saprospiraceae bacterium]|nr:HAD family hydrolase [Saprospiraceae bacterium]
MEKALVVLDLDETLIFGTKTPLDRIGDFMVGEYSIYLRPDCHHFLQEISKYFMLGIWSSAGELYVQEISNYFIDKGFQFEFVWSREKATYRRRLMHEVHSRDGDDAHQFYVKKLEKVKKHGFDLKRVLIIDDTPHKSSENYGNAIYPSIFEGDQKDGELTQLLDYLISIKDVENYRRVEKRNWRDQVR